MHLRLARSQVDPGIVLGKRNGPEEPILGDARGEVVDLVAEVGGDRPRKEVESYEAEGALVLLPVLADVLTLHDPHVGVIADSVTSSGWRRQSAIGPTADDRSHTL